jgi:hypothetical protein
MVRELAEQGHTHVAIVNAMRERFPQDWKAKNAHRTVSRILKDNPVKSAIPTPDMPMPSVKVPSMPKTLDEMTREERARYIEARLQTTPRFRMAFRSFAKEDKDVFVDEYMRIIRSTDTLTEVEEQALFAAILELILAFQALNRKEKEEQWRDQSLAGEIDEDDPRYRRLVEPKYQKEYDDHMKMYQRGTEQLKMSRRDRLKEVRSQKQTLIDLAEELSSKNAQSEVAHEIERLAKLRDDELKRLLELGHIHGVFADYE